MVDILVTLITSDILSQPPNSEVLEEVAEIIEQLARQRLQIQDFRIEAASIQRFGESSHCQLRSSVLSCWLFRWLQRGGRGTHGSWHGNGSSPVDTGEHWHDSYRQVSLQAGASAHAGHSGVYRKLHHWWAVDELRFICM